MSGGTFAGGGPSDPAPELAAVPEPDDEPDVPDADPQSVLAAVRAEWEKHSEERTFDYDLPGSRGMFVLRFGPIRGTTLSRVKQRYEQPGSKLTERDTNLNADVVVAACRGVFGRPRPGGELVQLEDEDGPIVRIDNRLAVLLGLDPTLTARKIVLALFRNANVPEVALNACAIAYMAWAAESAEDVGEELLGES